MLSPKNPKTPIKPCGKYPFRMVVLALALFVFQNESFAQGGTLTDNATFPANFSTLTVQGSSATDGSAASFVKFKLTPNLAPATPGGYVGKATLTLYVGTLNSPGSFNVYRVTGPWGEGATTAPTYDAANPATVEVPVTAVNSYVTVDLTALVQQWLGTDGLGAGGVPNYGIALVANTNTTAFSFDSKESTTTSHPPQLTIVLNHAATADSATSSANATTAATANALSNSATVNGTQVNGALTSATIAGISVTGPLAASQVTGDLANATIAGSSVNGEVANATNANSASAVMNGVYTVGDQTVGGNKTFTSPIVGNITGNAATATSSINATNADIAKSVVRATQDADIASPADGQVYYNTAANVFKVFDSATSTWKMVDAGTAATLSSAATIDGNQVNGELTNATIAGSAVTGNIAASQVSGDLANATIAGYVTKAGDTMGGTLNLPANGLTAGTNQLVLSAGNVGIGTTTPAFKLEVAGTSSVNDRTIAINNIPVAYVADQSIFPGSMALGNGLRGLNWIAAGDASYNTAVGKDALLSVTTGYFNTAVGALAMADNISGRYSTAIGEGALQHNTTGISNTAVGTSALNNNTTANYNVAVGLDALQFNVTGTENTAVGKRANWQATSGNYNVIVGTDAMYSNLTGSTNTALGHNALNANLASYNVAVGASALVSSTTGTENAAFGRAALLNITTANNNTAVGNLAGRYQADAATALTATTNSVYIGYKSMGFSNSDSNSIVIGASAQGIGANTVVLGNNSIVTTALKGNVGIGTTEPAERLEVVGNLKLSGAGNGLIFPDGSKLTTVATPGGTITGVTAGTGLSGGETSGNVTLNVNQGVVAFQSDLASEVSTRQSADTALQNNINSEVSNRTAADNALQTGINLRVAKGGDTMTGTLNLPTNGLVAGGNQLVLSGGNIGIGTNSPQTKLQVDEGNVYVGSAGQGIILKSPNGLVCKQLTIDNTGAMVLSALTCP